MTKSIALTQGKFSLVDDEDYEFISQWKWCYVRGGYAKRLASNPYRTILLHREIMQPPDDLEVDHINGDGLDNRRSNLRICNHAQNTQNRSVNKKSKSGMIGVYQVRDKWRAVVKVNYKPIHIGYFDKIEDAIIARDEAAKHYRGEYARLNT